MNVLASPPATHAPDGSAPLPPHLANTIETIARLHEAHERAASPVQRGVDRVTGYFARPGTPVWITLLCFAWIAGNLMAPRFALAPYDNHLEIMLGVLTFLAMLLTCLILATQRRADTLGAQRAIVTLELAILTEQKVTKTIALLEELRRDHPQIADRIDHSAEAMSAFNDAGLVHEALVELVEEARPIVSDPPA